MKGTNIYHSPIPSPTLDIMSCCYLSWKEGLWALGWIAEKREFTLGLFPPACPSRT